MFEIFSRIRLKEKIVLFYVSAFKIRKTGIRFDETVIKRRKAHKIDRGQLTVKLVLTFQITKYITITSPSCKNKSPKYIDFYIFNALI